MPLNIKKGGYVEENAYLYMFFVKSHKNEQYTTRNKEPYYH